MISAESTRQAGRPQRLAGGEWDANHLLSFAAPEGRCGHLRDDSGAGAPTDGRRYRTYGVGPFVSYKLPGKDAGFNLQYSDNFGGRNAIATRALQLRFVKAW